MCGQAVPDDGLLFDPASVTTAHITEDADYEGVRVTLKGTLGTSRISIQIDIGFSDVVVPSPGETDYPTILDFPAPRLKAYSRETVVAEKLQAMVSLGEGNSRMKDFADIWFLSRHFAFDGKTLAHAIAQTFARRGTAMPSTPLAMTTEFASHANKQMQWSAFIRRTNPRDVPVEFGEVVADIAAFLGPVAKAIATGTEFSGTWATPGAWRE